MSIITAFAGFICLSLLLFSNLPARSEKSGPSLSSKANQLKEAVVHERTAEVISILESAESTKEIHAVGDLISRGFFANVTYSSVLDGNKETIMFYHVCAGWVQPVAGIVKNRPKTSVSK